MEKYVYFFGDGKADGNGTMKDALGGKGAGLAEMTNAGLPVPPGFTIVTSACRLYFQNGNHTPAEILEQKDEALAKLETLVGQKLGDPVNPLAGLRAFRGQILDARHDGHGPEPWHER